MKSRKKAFFNRYRAPGSAFVKMIEVGSWQTKWARDKIMVQLGAYAFGLHENTWPWPAGIKATFLWRYRIPFSRI